jgi:hypothetical protein
MVSCSYGYPRNRTPTHPSEKSIFLQQLPLDGDGAGVPPGRAYGGLRVRTGSLGPPGDGSQTGSLRISLPPGERRAAPRLRRAGAPSNITAPPSSASISLRNLRSSTERGSPVRVAAETRTSGNTFHRNMILGWTERTLVFHREVSHFE